jgi:tetratricopeptide (TPR) repeat protein
VFPVPNRLQRLADQIDGWLDLRCPERALELLDPVLADPEGRAAGLCMRIRALVRQGQHDLALADLAELRRTQQPLDWIDLTEAWCRKRSDDLAGAIRCMEQLLARTPRSDIGHFNLACYLAIAGQRDRAVDEATVACGINPDLRDLLRDEPDLDSLRNDPRFRQLMRERRAHGRATPGHFTEGDEELDAGEEADDPDRN